MQDAITMLQRGQRFWIQDQDQDTSFDCEACGQEVDFEDQIFCDLCEDQIN